MKLAVDARPIFQGRNYFVVGIGLMLVVIATLVALSYSVFGISAGWAQENGVLELAQQVLLAIAGLVFAASTQFDRKGNLAVERPLIFSALCITFLLRETDVADPSRFAWLSFWLDASGKKLLLAVTWLLVIFYVSAKWPWASMVRRNFIFDGAFWTLAFAAAFLSVSWAIDREHVTVANHLAIEELSEVLAYGLMVVAALLLFRKHASLPDITSARFVQ